MVGNNTNNNQHQHQQHHHHRGAVASPFGHNNASNHNHYNPSSSSWFLGAPTTKLITLWILAFHLVVKSQPPIKRALFFVAPEDALDSFPSSSSSSSPFAVDNYRYWTCLWTFASTGEFIMGTSLLALWLRKFEREMGSRSCCAWLLFVAHVTILVEWVWMQILGGNEIYNNVLMYPGGPYPLLGACACLFHAYTPRLYPNFGSVLGITFSEKAFFYLWFAQVATAGGFRSAVPAAIGWTASLAYLQLAARGMGGGGGSGAGSFRSSSASSTAAARGSSSSSSSSLQIILWDAFPNRLVHWAGQIGMRLAADGVPRILVPAMGRQRARAPAAAAAAAAAQQPLPGSSPSHRAGAGAPAQQQQQQHQQPILPVPAAAAAAVVVPDPAAVEQLCNMGFERDAVVDALRATHNNVAAAADRLLMQPSD